MTDIYFECKNGISGDMSVAALLDAGADVKKLETALDSLKLQDEFTYKITKVSDNAVSATDFDVILPEGNHKHAHEHSCEEHTHTHEPSPCHNHIHRNLADVKKIIDNADMSDNAKAMAKKIFNIVAEAEAKVHGKDINEVHFHETGAMDSIADIVAFSVLYDDLEPCKAYFSALTEGTGTVMCQHGLLNVPVPAVCEIVAKYKIPVKLTDNEGEMITPTGAAIVATLYDGSKLPDEIIIKKVGNGAGKRKYKNPVLRVMLTDTVSNG